MALLFHIPGVTPLDTSGNTMSGCKLQFYLTGTVTPTDVYSDDELATPHANPVVADSAGYFAPIYMDPAVAYKAVLLTSADVTLKTWDLAVDVFETTGTYTGTITGCTTSPTGTVRWVKYGEAVTLFIPIITGTSNTTACTLTGMPVTIRPARNQGYQQAMLQDNSGLIRGHAQVLTSGVIEFRDETFSSTGFVNSGTKGSDEINLTYTLL